MKASGGNQTTLSADNFVGFHNSHVYLAKFIGSPGVAIEWVREDQIALNRNGGVFPTPPGVYYVQVQEQGDCQFCFFVDSLLEVRGEVVAMSSPTEGQLAHPPWKGSLRIYEMPAAFQLYEGVNYTLDASTGAITLTEALPEGRYIVADYKYPGESTGPHAILPNHANTTAIPGVVLAFGRRLGHDDKMAVVVSPTRAPAALEYGGRWDLSIEIEITARDVEEQEEIADQTVVYLWGIARSRMSSEGIEMMEASLGGETEEVYDEVADDYFYSSMMSLQIQTDWFIHVPILGYLQQVSPLTLEQQKFIAGLDDDELAGHVCNIKNLGDAGLEIVVDPYLAGRTFGYEIPGEP